jgi:hypothetical protein
LEDEASVASLPSVVKLKETSRPLDSCRLDPVLDWVQVQVTLPTPSQHRHLRARAPRHWGNVFFHPVEGQHSSRVFIFRVQNPQGPDQLMSDLQELLADPSARLREESVQIVGIEIALDAYPERPNRELLVDATVQMIWHVAQPPHGTLLMTEPDHYRANPLRRSIRQALQDGWSLNIAPGGRKGESKLGPSCSVDRLRAYVKDYDTVPVEEEGTLAKGEPHQPLPEHQQRARLERTLLGNKAPFKTIDEWRSYRFEKQAGLFAMCVSDPDSSSFMKILHSAVPMGKPLDLDRRAARRRVSRAGTLRDSLLNERIRVSLRRLTRAQRAGIRTPTPPS